MFLHSSDMSKCANNMQPGQGSELRPRQSGGSVDQVEAQLPLSRRSGKLSCSFHLAGLEGEPFFGEYPGKRFSRNLHPMIWVRANPLSLASAEETVLTGHLLGANSSYDANAWDRSVSAAPDRSARRSRELRIWQTFHSGRALQRGEWHQPSRVLMV